VEASTPVSANPSLTAQTNLETDLPYTLCLGPLVLISRGSTEKFGFVDFIRQAVLPEALPLLRNPESSSDSYIRRIKIGLSP
jgi:hypothetical protein